jgi:hypothetical protein
MYIKSFKIKAKGGNTQTGFKNESSMVKENGNTLSNTPYATGKFIEEAKRKEFFQKKTDMLKGFDI